MRFFGAVADKVDCPIGIQNAPEFLGVGQQAVRRRIAAGELRAYRIGNRHTVRIDMADLEALLVPIPTTKASRDVVAGYPEAS